MGSNISKERRRRIQSCMDVLRKQYEQDNDDQNVLYALNLLESELSQKKYGLIWEEHVEEIDHVLSANLPILTDRTDLTVNNGGQQNFLLEGDNLAALEILKRTHTGKVDIIYIDPPYNRGKNDFIYDDDYIDSEDSYRHSKWLSFMRRRMEAARILMSESSLIFISIDDNEVAQLKLLCDEIFSAENFINLFIWKRNSSGKTEKTKFTVNSEYVLLYTKSSSYALNPTYKPLSPSTIALYKKDDGDGRGRYRLYPLQKPKSPGPETTYDYVDNNGKVWKCPSKGWRLKQEKLKALENDGRLCLENKTLSEKAYWNERNNEGKRVDTLWTDLPENNVGSSEMSSIFGKSDVFDNPKPIDLIKRCLEIGPKNACVLDFFAGSGTTMHAAMTLNKDDGGNRRVILCTNNANNICRNITYERAKTAITGKRADGSKYSDGFKASLKYMKIDYVATAKDGEPLFFDEYAERLLEHVRELVELENAVDFSSDSSMDIALQETEIDDIVRDESKLTELDKLYIGHDVLLSDTQKNILKSHDIGVNIIPEYYYANEVGA